MIPDIKTVMLLYVVINVINVGAMALIWSQNRKRYAGISFWLADMILQAAGATLIVLRGMVGDFASFILANTMIQAGALIIFIGLERFTGKQSRQIHNYMLLAVFIAVLVYFFYIQPSLSIRNIALSAVTLIITSQCCWLLLRRVDPGLRGITQLTGIVFACYAAFSFTRIIMSTIIPVQSDDFFKSGAVDAIAITIYIILSICLTVSLIVMVNRRLLADVKMQEEKFTLAFHYAPYGISLTRSSDGRIFEVNDGFSLISGYQYSELIGKTTIDLHLWGNEADRLAVVTELAQGHSVSNREYQFRKKTGEIITGLFSASVITINNETCILSSITDITERKRSEESLRMLLSWQKAILAAVPNVIAEVDNNKVYTWANQAAYDFYGEDLIGKEANFYFEGEQDTYDIVQPLFQDKENMIYVESWQRRRDGEKRLLAWLCRILKDENGKVTGALSSALDITESKLAEQNLRQSEEKFRNVFDNSAIGKSITAIDGTVSVNQAMADMLGYTREELAHLNWKEITYPEDIEETEKYIVRFQSGLKDPVRFTKRYVKKDGSILWADVNTLLQRDDDGKPLYYITGVMDVTARKQAEEKIIKLNEELEQRVTERTAQLEAVNRELEKFAYSVSHDLRGPLRGIDGWSQALLEDCKDKLSKKESEYLRLVRSEAQNMGRLIDDLLNFSRQSHAEMKLQHLDITGMAQAIVSHIKRQDRPIQVDFIIQPGLTAEGDASLIEIVLNNLLDNAVKFSSKNPHACVELGQVEQGGKKAFFVRDNGVGFDMTYAHKLFGVFQRLHKSSEFPGTGIGLASVQRIISRHGGRVWAEAKVNEGATFYFTLEEAI